MSNSVRLVLTALVLTAGFDAKPSAQASPEAAPMKTYLVVYRPGPAWIPDKPQSEQPLKEHGRYMLGLYVQKKMKFAGPFTDNGAGGAAVLEVEGDEEAKAVVAADPAVTSQVFVAELRPWTLVEWERHVKR
jgi:uncharacterized protein YciI